MDRLKPLFVRIPEELHTDLSFYAELSRRSKQEIATKLLADFFKEPGRRAMLDKYIEERGGNTDELP